MAIRIGKSFADLLNSMNQLTAGFSTAENDPKQSSYAKELTATYEMLRGLDDRQEKAKAELHTVSKELKAKQKEARLLVGRAISYLESELGKSNPEIEKFGIAKRRPASKGKKAEPKAVK